MDQEALDGAAAYRPTDFMADVRKGIWHELDDNGSVKIDPYRRNLQSAYIDLMSAKLNGRAPAPDEQRPLFRGELRTLSQDITRALAKPMDRAVRLHLEDTKDQIAKALDPKFQPAEPPAGQGAGRGGRGGLTTMKTCSKAASRSAAGRIMRSGCRVIAATVSWQFSCVVMAR